ncbi:MAG: amidohydrolase 2, partial [Conexibacter sp.]|nr:amidohydrolase 2 [Conexibacter sp.]
MRIDAHAHVIPDAYRHELDRRQLLDFPLPPASAEGLAAMLERHAIDGAIVSPSPPGVAFGDQPLADHLARLLNEKLSAVRRDLPQCVGALAILPLPDVERALTELAYALDVLKLDGVMLLSNVLGTYLGDPALDPLMAELDRRATHVFIHPQQPPYAPPLGEHPVWLYEYPFDTTRAVVNLIYSGTLERYPQITFQLSHLGGAAPYLGHRIASLATRVPAAGAAAPLGALAYLERLQYDTGLADNAIQLAAMRLVAPARQILFGTDWPYAPLPAAGDPQPALAAFGDDRAAV